jgi:small-conductance mechanosensitive channel
MKEYLMGILDQRFWESTLQALSSWAIKTIPSVILVFILALAALLLFRIGISRLTKLLLKKSERDSSPMEARRQVETLTGILRKAGKVVIWAVALMMLLREIGIEIGPVLAGAGIAGLAIGFGAQNIVRDIISGFFILVEGQVRVGDVAVINGKGGLVEAINLRTIVLRDLEGVVHVFPHGQVDTVANMTKEWSAALFDIGVAYKEDTDKVVDVMKQVAEDLKIDPALGSAILEPMEIFGVDDFQDSAVVIKARLKTKPLQQWAVGREYRRRLKKAFDAKGIEIPFPHRTVIVGKSSEAFKVLMKNP